MRAKQGSLLLGDNAAYPGYSEQIMVIGRRPDTANYIGVQEHNVLNLATWDMNVNTGWIDRGIAEGRTFLLASDVSFATLRQMPELKDGAIVRDLTVFFQEVKRLRDAGYQSFTLLDGRLIMVPPGKK
jgi:hypothetical protein